MSAPAMIKLGLQASIALCVLVLGLRASWRDATYLFRAPRLFAASFVSMNVLMPALVVMLALTFALAPPVVIAMAALSVSPVPPFLPRKELNAGGHEDYTIGLLTASAVLSVAVIPIALEVFQRIFDIPLGMSAGAIIRIVVSSVLAPLVLGLAIHDAAPAFAERVRRPLDRLAIGLLLVTAGMMLFGRARPMWSLVGNGTLLALIVFNVAGVVAGHWLGGPDRDDRTVLALSTASRHPAVAVSIAGATFPEQKLALAAVLLALVVNAAVSAAYLGWSRRHPPQQPPHRALAEAGRRAA